MSSIPSIGRIAAIAIVSLLALSVASGCGPAAKPPYAFSAVASDIPLKGDAVIDVRLMPEPTGKPVENAVIIETRFDMAPDGMGGMPGEVTSQGSPEPGVYRFAVKPTMAGRWELKLSAKVQGEAETVHGSVIVTAR
jgi:phospholipase/lecithinase/hemolysin